jgi:hypothetical protein
VHDCDTRAAHLHMLYARHHSPVSCVVENHLLIIAQRQKPAVLTGEPLGMGSPDLRGSSMGSLTGSS